jgi:hypothetical protein
MLWDITLCSPLISTNISGQHVASNKHSSTCCLLHAGFLLGFLLLNPDDGGDRFFRTTGWLPTYYSEILYIPEDRTDHNHCCVNLKSHKPRHCLPASVALISNPVSTNPFSLPSVVTSFSYPLVALSSFDSFLFCSRKSGPLRYSKHQLQRFTSNARLYKLLVAYPFVCLSYLYIRARLTTLSVFIYLFTVYSRKLSLFIWNAYRIGKPEGKQPLAKPRRRWEDINNDLKRARVGWYGLD